VLHRLAELDAELRSAAENFEFNRYARLITSFANDDLSAFFFDIRKDSLYCDDPSAVTRRAYRTVLDRLFETLVRWIAPILCFTAEEVWLSRYPEAKSVHLETWPDVHAAWHDPELADRWAVVRAVRAEVFARLEQLRRDKVIGSSMEARVSMLLDGNSFRKTDGINWSEILIVGGAEVREATPEPSGDVSLPHSLSVLADVERTDNEKCGRCWRHLPEVAEHGGLCARCDEVIHADSH